MQLEDSYKKNILRSFQRRALFTEEGQALLSCTMLGCNLLTDPIVEDQREASWRSTFEDNAGLVDKDGARSQRLVRVVLTVTLVAITRGYQPPHHHTKS
jgi:hypothetical protein